MGQIKADMYGFADWRKEEFLKNLMTSVLLQKDQVQDQRIDRLDSQIDDLNRKLDVIFPDWNISGYSYNDVTSNKDIMDYETLRKDIVNSG